MKKVIVLLLCSLLLVGCKDIEKVEDQKHDKSMFILIEQTNTYAVVFHRDTKVMYAVSCGGYNAGDFTLLVNPDGSPMLYEED